MRDPIPGTKIIPNLFIGDIYAAYNKNNFLIKNKISVIISIIQDFNYNYKFTGINYIFIPYRDLDICKINTIKFLNLMADFIKYLLLLGYNILVHCRNGHHRSASVIAAYLIKYNNMDYLESLSFINNKRQLTFQKPSCITRGIFLLYYYLKYNIQINPNKLKPVYNQFIYYKIFQ